MFLFGYCRSGCYSVYQTNARLTKQDIEQRVASIAEKLIEDVGSSFVKEGAKTLLLTFRDNVLPLDMQTWAQAVRRLELEGFYKVGVNFLDIDWNHIETVVRAGQGHRGAWFYVHESGASVVVKTQEGAKEQLIGLFRVEDSKNDELKRFIVVPDKDEAFREKFQKLQETALTEIKKILACQENN